MLLARGSITFVAVRYPDLVLEGVGTYLTYLFLDRTGNNR